MTPSGPRGGTTPPQNGTGSGWAGAADLGEQGPALPGRERVEEEVRHTRKEESKGRDGGRRV